jgi:hypothetical protein
MNLCDLTPLELLQLQGAVINELRKRSIMRTSRRWVITPSGWLLTI